MKFFFSILIILTSSSVFSQTNAKYFTIYNDEIILTGNDRLNIYSDVIDSIKILKGQDTSNYFENADGIINIYLRNKINKPILTKADINEILNLPKDRVIYINGIKLLKDLNFTLNSKTKIEKIKINGNYFSNLLVEK